MGSWQGSASSSSALVMPLRHAFPITIIGDSGGAASGTGKMYLDSELAWPPESPMIVIGNACRNGITKALLDDAEPCQLPIQDTGIIKILEYNNQPILLIYGNTDEAARTAARALSSFSELDGLLNGTAV